MLQNNEKIEDLLKNVFYDIKAEAIIADLIENGLKPDNFIAIPKGIFKRRYARDIDSVSSLKLNNTQSILAFKLNRDSLYDALPEGLFHERSANTLTKKEQTSNESKRLKQEEKAARNFFLPFENEILRQRVLLELEERKILSNFSTQLFDDIYPELWNIHKSLNQKYVYKMVLLLHFAHKIAGNLQLTAECLESILEEEVTIKLIRNSERNLPEIENNKREEESCMLGNAEMGVDFVCGEQFVDYGKTMEFSIGPLKNSNVSEYLENGTLSKFLTCFFGYFVPIDFDVDSKIIVAPLEQGFELNEIAGGPVLGFETAI